jgi:RNA polymerase sigma factor for flagellar operon FliA
MTPEQLFLDNLPLIKKVVAQTCHCCNLQKDEAEEFLSEVQDKIMADDYAVLRKFEGKSSLKSYLTIVIKNQMRDFQNHLWGKWRHSEMAKRLGPVAMELEKLLRDGYTFDETVAILQTNHKVEMSWRELNEIAAKLPPRTPRHREGEEILELLPSSGAPPDAGVRKQEKHALKVRALAALKKALRSSLSAEDRLILKMQLWNGFSIAEISKVLKLDQKPLYKRIQRVKEQLRKEIELQGIRKEDIDDLFDDE